MSQITCPSCFKGIPRDRIFDEMTVCECGQVIHLSGNKPSEGNSRAILVLVIFTLAIIGSFIHVANWDKHAGTILPLKAKQILGLANVEEYKLIAKICKERKKYFCQERALSSAYHLDKTQKRLLLVIGELQMNREAYPEAVRTYSSFFSSKGKSREARLNLAIALDHGGQTKEAKRHLKYLVYSNKRELQANAARTYVSILMKAGQLQEAQKVIRYCRGIGNSASLFMEKEYKEVRKRLKNGPSA